MDPNAALNLTRLDLLPRLRNAVTVASESSYDRTGGNDDGFSGKYSFLRREGETLVIAELTGPGIVQRLWTPTPTDDPLEFYFDGEATPRLAAPFGELFSGAVPGLPAPLVMRGNGGFASYVPLPYARSLKIVYRGPRMQFFQINHARLPEGATIESFRPDWAQRHPEVLAAASAWLNAPGQDLSALVAPPGARLETVATTQRLEPGGRIALFSADRGGRVVGLRLAPASALAGGDRAIALAMTFDDAPAPQVLCPAGDFFGFSWGQPAMRAALVGVDADDTAYCYLPLPFDRAARIELISDGERTVDIMAETVHCAVPRADDEGHFYALWRRENPTTIGIPFTFVEASGRGHLIGTSLQAQGMTAGSTYFFEGDDQATIDGTLAIHGTGTEDFYNGGWYDIPGRWNGRRSLPLSGCLDYQKHLGRSAGYRWMIPDPVVFHKSLLQTIEHAPEKNDLLTDYVGVGYLYADRPPAGAGTLPDLAERAVVDPQRLIFAVGWQLPLVAFSFQNATLAKRAQKLDGVEARALSHRADGPDLFGDHFIELSCEAPAAGRYAVALDILSSPDVGAVELRRDDLPLAPRIDLSRPEGIERRTVAIGELEMERGANSVYLALLPGATGRTGLDLIAVLLERRNEP